MNDRVLQDNNPTVHVEQAVQYYRASSFMLVLSSYNNTASLAPTDGNATAPAAGIDIPLPIGTNTTFLNCLNSTIGEAVPIMDAEVSNSMPPFVGAAPGTLHAVEGLNAIGMLWLVIWF
jgi:hypothetical protein